MKYWSRKNIIKNLLGLLLLPLFLVVFFRWFERKQVYYPLREFAATGAEVGQTPVDVELTTQDKVKLHAWFYPSKADSPRKDWVVLVSHGNGGNISHRIDLYSVLLDTGVSILAYDYRGYGKSHGKPSEKGTYLDGQAALAWLRQKGFASEKIILFGESLGGGISTELALNEKIGGLVLMSTFTSVPKIAKEIFPWIPVKTLGTIHYDNEKKLKSIKVPILILHGRQDTIIRFHHGEQNFEAANPPKWLKEIEGDHNDSMVENPRLIRNHLEDFFKELDRPIDPPSP